MSENGKPKRAADHAPCGWLAGDVALITGAASGLGAAVARRFLIEGASVALVDRNAERLAALVTEIAEPQRVLSIKADVTSPADMQHAVATTIGHFGKLDTLVTNAGIWDYQRPLAEIAGEQLAVAFDEVFAVNVKGYMLAAEAAWPYLSHSRGNIVMTLSNASFFPNGGGPIYTASKHACLGLMRELAYELAPTVRVNGVACGAMRTDLRGPMALGLAQRSIKDSFARNPADDRLVPLYDSSVEPEDFTAPFVLLASSANSRNITGTSIAVDGGIGVRGFRRSRPLPTNRVVEGKRTPEAFFK